MDRRFLKQLKSERKDKFADNVKLDPVMFKLEITVCQELIHHSFVSQSFSLNKEPAVKIEQALNKSLPLSRISYRIPLHSIYNT